MYGPARAEALRGARERYDAQDWEGAYRLLRGADAQRALEVADVERLARAAYMLGLEDVFLQELERAHRMHTRDADALSAARTAFWLGITLLFQGEMGSAMGWFARAERTLQGRAPSAESGYLLLPVAQKHLMGGRCEAAYEAAGEAAEIGARFEDRDLVALARHLQGRARLTEGQVEAGLALLDETMIAVTGGEVSPRAAGMIYCSVIAGCQEVYALERAREWTQALARWCDAQASLVAFTGTCLIHRAQVLQVAGAWTDAASEAERAHERLLRLRPPRSGGLAHYQLGEIHRLRGAFDAAEAAYGAAAKAGYDPQPGLALLRVAQGRQAQARASVDRVLLSTSPPLQRIPYLAAGVEICVACGDAGAARAHSEELERIASELGTPALRALSDDARGALELAAGNAAEALVFWSRAAEVWQAIPAPYAHARTLVNVARACRSLGDLDGCALRREAARAALAELGAAADLRALDEEMQRPDPSGSGSGSGTAKPGGLSARELEVLRLIATGKPNKSIAAALHLSVKTVDRHVSNIFTKLKVASRAEATACAYEKKLL